MKGVGVVSPILFLCGIQLRAIPGPARTPLCPVLTCTRRDSPFHRSLPVRISELTRPGGLLARRLSRIIATGRTCRFCAIAVTLATRTCMRLRVRMVWGLSSAAQRATVSRTLPLLLILHPAIYMGMDGIAGSEGKTAVRYARAVLEEHIGKKSSEYPALPESFEKMMGVFVTLTIQGDLRGCIGFPTPVMPLREGIREAALSAALRDPRFPPVRPDELDSITVEVTILTLPAPVRCPPEERPRCIQSGRDGLIIAGMGKKGLLLPQVAAEYGWDEEELLDHTCLKAGLPSGSWRRHDVDLFSFQGQVFSENEEQS